MKRYELVVVGGGMAGFTLLAALKPAIDRGLRVALVDPAPIPTTTQVQSPSFDDRATALSEQALTTLKNLQLKGMDEAISNIQSIEVSDRGHLGYLQMTAQEAGFQRYGAVISNRSLGALLWQSIQSIAVDWYFESSVTQGQLIQEGAILSLSNGKSIEADLTILCDGGRSTLTNSFGLPARERAFHARARIATVKTNEPHRGVAFERFTEQGPIALLPFGEFSALVWTIPDDRDDAVPHTPSDALDWLNLQFGQRLGRVTDISEWHEYPLVEKTIQQSVAHGVLALGNTAATLHPVAGQGFNLAIRGISRSAKCINDSWMTQQRVPDFNELNNLAVEIKNDQDLTVQFSRELINIFGHQNPVVQLSRGLGLNSLDRHPTFSRSFALASMGLLAGAPSLQTSFQESI